MTAPTPTHSAAPRLRSFSARQLAARLGRCPKSVASKLRDVPARHFLETKHAERPVAAWTIAELPQSLRAELATRARGYRTIEDFLTDVGSQWQPDVVLKECSDADVADAARLQKALLPFLVDERPDLRADEFETAGAEAYASVFGKKISTRHWRRLHRMVLDRLRGSDDFDRVEIFLPVKQIRREDPAAVVSQAVDHCFDLSTVIRGCSNPQQPTLVEWEVIQRRACEHFDGLLLSGLSQKSAMRQLGEQLAGTLPFLHKSRHAIRLAVSRWLKKWREHGAAPEAVLDGRQSNSGNRDNYTFPVSDFELLVGTAVWRHDGDVAAAWRELWHTAKFTPATMKHFGQWARSRKSDVPKSVMQAVRFEVDILRRWRLGARGCNSMRATVNVSDCPLPPMLVVSADDFTPDCCYGVEIAPGKDRMVRGQVLFFINVGTMRIIGFVMAPAASYNAVMILGEMTRICCDIAVPAGWAFERGIWKRSNAVKGVNRATPGFSETEREGRFERLGVKFSHAVSPQGKARMERTIKAIQELLRASPGWCGNDEKVTCPKETRQRIDQVNRGELRARDDGFDDGETFEARLCELCQIHNSSRQEGKVLKRLSPDEAWEQFFNPDYLPTKFTPELEYLLTEHIEEVKVTINGIRLPFDKGVQYKCAELARYTGEIVKVSLPVLEWSKTGLPDKVIVAAAAAGKHHFTAYRETAVHPAMWLLDPDCDDLRKAKRENAGMEAPMKELLKKLNPRFNTLPPAKPLRTRQTVGDAEAHEKGRVLADSRSKTNPTDRKRDMGNRWSECSAGWTLRKRPN